MKQTSICPVCKKSFTYPLRKDRVEQTTCSKSCSFKYFRTGKNHPNYKGTDYVDICFRHHEKKCIVCGEEKIVSVHHFDEDSKNNSPENLIPLCPTHHQYVHSRYCLEVFPKIKEYRDLWISKHLVLG